MENRFMVTIHDKSYPLISDRSEDFIQDISKYVDKKIGAFYATGEKVPFASAVIYAALSIAEDFYAERESVDRIRDQFADYSNEISECKYQIQEFKDGAQKLEEEIGKLKIENVMLKNELAKYSSQRREK